MNSPTGRLFPGPYLDIASADDSDAVIGMRKRSRDCAATANLAENAARPCPAASETVCPNAEAKW